MTSFLTTLIIVICVAILIYTIAFVQNIRTSTAFIEADDLGDFQYTDTSSYDEYWDEKAETERFTRKVIRTASIIAIMAAILLAPVWTVYQKGGVLAANELKEATNITYEKVETEDGVYQYIAHPSTPVVYENVMLKEGAPIYDQNLLQIAYRWATDKTRIETEQIDHIGLTMFDI